MRPWAATVRRTPSTIRNAGPDDRGDRNVSLWANPRGAAASPAWGQGARTVEWGRGRAAGSPSATRSTMRVARQACRHQRRHREGRTRQGREGLGDLGRGARRQMLQPTHAAAPFKRQPLRARSRRCSTSTRTHTRAHTDATATTHGHREYRGAGRNNILCLAGFYIVTAVIVAPL